MLPFRLEIEPGKPMTFSVRKATADDAPILALLVVELARDESLEAEARPNVARLAEHLGDGANPRVHCLVVEDGSEPVGFAIYYFGYSTLETGWGICVEELFVRKEHRGKGAGKALLRRVGEVALTDGHRWVDLNVPNWNQAAIEAYERLGALHLSEWARVRFGGYAIRKLAWQE
jgi:GNAT superfamily N-acetyltransferase